AHASRAFTSHEAPLTLSAASRAQLRRRDGHLPAPRPAAMMRGCITKPRICCATSCAVFDPSHISSMDQHVFDPERGSDRDLPLALPPEAEAEIAAFAKRWKRANGPVMAVLNRFGGQLEAQLGHLPEGFRDRIEAV